MEYLNLLFNLLGYIHAVSVLFSPEKKNCVRWCLKFEVCHSEYFILFLFIVFDGWVSNDSNPTHTITYMAIGWSLPVLFVVLHQIYIYTFIHRHSIEQNCAHFVKRRDISANSVCIV